MRLRTPSRRVAATVLFPLALGLVLFEATVWRLLTRVGALLARRLPLFAALERLVERLSPGMVVAAFLLPFLAAVPLLKLGEIWLFVHGHLALGLALLVGAKVVGVSFSARLFAIARPKMLQVRWFAWTYGHATRLLALGHALLDSIPAWAAARAFVRRAKDLAGARAVAVWAWLRARGGGQGGAMRRQLRAARRVLER